MKATDERMRKMVDIMHIHTDLDVPFLCITSSAGASKYPGTAPKIRIIGVSEHKKEKIKRSKAFIMFSLLLLLLLALPTVLPSNGEEHDGETKAALAVLVI